jgi:hypothetical protein
MVIFPLVCAASPANMTEVTFGSGHERGAY